MYVCVCVCLCVCVLNLVKPVEVLGVLIEEVIRCEVSAPSIPPYSALELEVADVGTERRDHR